MGKTLYGGTGNDCLIGGTGNDYMYGGGGNDQIYGEDGDDKSHGGTGDDDLYGGRGNDKLYGQEGDDSLYGQEGDDYLYGGAGDDFLNGGSGSDIYDYYKGNGNDIIAGYSSSNIDLNKDKLYLNQIKLDQVEMKLSGNDLVIDIKETNEHITLEDYFSGGAAALGEIIFADHAVVTYEDIIKQQHIIEGTDEMDHIVLTHQSGNVAAHGKKGDDIIEGSPVNDYLYGEAGNDILYGAAGDDRLYGSTGNDVLEGGLGNDYLEGGTGNDTYIYKKGDGNDRINNSSSGNTDVDELYLKDIGFDEVELTVSGRDLVILVTATNETVTISRFFSETKSEVEKITFADGTILTPQDVLEQKTIKALIKGATDEADHMQLEPEGLTVYGKIGDDELIGSAGKDYIYGGPGNDMLYGGAGDDVLYGEAGNDVLYGGPGNDILSGGTGDDTYVYRKGDGHDKISNGSSASEDIDILYLQDIHFDETQLEVSEGSLRIRIKETNEVIKIDNYFNEAKYELEQIKFAGDTVLTYEDVIAQETIRPFIVEGSAQDDRIELEAVSNKVYTHSKNGNDQIIGSSVADYIFGGSGNDEIYGNDGADIIYGGLDDDTLYGGAGNDTLYGESGRDTLYGGTGNDFLDGGSGDDTYIFNLGDGQDIIYDNDAKEGNVDTVILGDTAEHLIFARQDNNLVISNRHTTDTVTIKSWYVDEAHKVECFKTADHYALDYREVDALIDVMAYFETEKGMSWNSLDEYVQEEAKEVLYQFWTVPTI